MNTTMIAPRIRAAGVLSGLAAFLLTLPNMSHAAIAQRGSVTTTNTAGASITVNVPTGVIQGDLMIACIAQYGTASGAATSAGWTALKSGTLASTSRYGTTLYRVAGASEPVSYTYTLTPSGSVALGDIVAFSGVDTNTPLDIPVASLPALATVSSASVTASAIATVTPTAALIMLGLAATAGAGGGTWSGWTAGLTEIADHQGTGTVNNATSIGMAWTNGLAAGSTISGSATLSTSMRNGGLLVALRPYIPPADATNSTLSAAPATVFADGVDYSMVTATVKDSGSTVIAGKWVSLASSRGATDTVSAASGVSSSSGTVTFTVSSTTTGTSVYSATITNDSLTVTQKAAVVYMASTNKTLLSFGTNVLGSSAVISNGAGTIAWTVPYGSDATAMAPGYTISPAAAGSPLSGAVVDFTTPQTYTITAQDGSTKPYVVTVTVAPSSTNKDIFTFTFPGQGNATITGTNITITLPAGTPVTSLTPTYTVSPLALGSPASGTARNFTTPQTYTVTAQDLSAKIYRVTVTVTVGPQNYAIALSTDLGQEFSPMNLSGHPIMTGLSSYANSLGTKNLNAAGQMLAPWNVNVGAQVMMCSDCHDAGTTNYIASAAQGPHGSAAQFILRGPNGANWPNVPLSSFGSSWCANCHQKGTGREHTQIQHSSLPCYNCHVVVPHGGKMSRLMADRDGAMPARYAWQNQTNNVSIQSFTKTTLGNYVEGNCQASCGDPHNTAASENWSAP